jgi:hypothetical protein
VSARAGRVISLGEKINDALAVPDEQALGLRNLEVADENFVRAFEEHFAGTDVLQNREKVRAATILRNSIKRGHEKQLDAIIEMGRALIRAERVFTRQEWDHLLAGGQRLIGLPKNTASMYRAIARDIDAGRLPRDHCPESFSTAYILTTYEDWRLDAAKERGLLRPTVTRKEIEHFKRLPPAEIQAEGKGGRAGNGSGWQEEKEATKLEAEERDLCARERRLLDALAAVQGRLAAIRQQLGKVPD